MRGYGVGFGRALRYMEYYGIHPWSWNLTERNLVWYDAQHRRHLVPLSTVASEVERILAMESQRGEKSPLQERSKE